MTPSSFLFSLFHGLDPFNDRPPLEKGDGSYCPNIYTVD